MATRSYPARRLGRYTYRNPSFQTWRRRQVPQAAIREPNTTVTVHKTTGDYSTVQAAVDDCSVLIGTGWYKIEIQDAEEYNERVTIEAAEITTPSISHYLWLTAASGVRHDGTPGTGHARMKYNWEPLIIKLAYTRVEYLQIETQTTVGREAIQIYSGSNNTLISHCVVKAGYSNATGIMILSGNLGPITASIDNCVIFGAGDAGVIIYQQSAGGSDEYTFNIDYCTILKNGNDASDVNSGAVVVWGDAAGTDATINMYNTIAAGTVNDTDVAVNDSTTRDTITSGGTAVWNGSHNLHTSNTDDIDGTGITDNTTNWQDASAGGSTVTTTTANAVIVTNLTDNAEDFTLLAATGGGSNLALANGTNRIGSEPDARQDFSLDIAGNTRPIASVDIGAFQISTPTPNTWDSIRSQMEIAYRVNELTGDPLTTGQNNQPNQGTDTTSDSDFEAEGTIDVIPDHFATGYDGAQMPGAAASGFKSDTGAAGWFPYYDGGAGPGVTLAVIMEFDAWTSQESVIRFSGGATNLQIHKDATDAIGWRVGGGAPVYKAGGGSYSANTTYLMIAHIDITDTASWLEVNNVDNTPASHANVTWDGTTPGLPSLTTGTDGITFHAAGWMLGEMSTALKAEWWAYAQVAGVGGAGSTSPTMFRRSPIRKLLIR